MKEILIERLKKSGVEIISIEALSGDNTNDMAIVDFYDELHKINDKYNQNLNKMTLNPEKGFVLALGKPSVKLLSVGIQDKPIKLHSSKLVSKATKHEYHLTDLMNLPRALADPIAIFKGSEVGSFAVITELEINDKKVLAVISVGKNSDSDFNMIRSAYGKKLKGIIDWINKDKMLFVDKDKVLEYLRISAPIAEAIDKQELLDATKLIEIFENPKFERQIKDCLINGSSQYIKNSNNDILGLTRGNRIYLTPKGFNPETMVHEYTHVWATAMRYGNPDGWQSIKDLLCNTSLWIDIKNNPKYSDLNNNEDYIASEVLAHISGRENAAKLQAMASLNSNNIMQRIRYALQKFWAWVGKHMFDINRFNSITEITDRVLYDLARGVKLETGKPWLTIGNTDVGSGIINKESRISHITVFEGRNNQPYIRCKIDGVQQMGVPVKPQDKEAVYDPQQLQALVQQYFAKALQANEEPRSIKR